MRIFETIAELQPLVGQDIGTSEWITVTQERIQLFADATNDHQWIHLDAERAKAGPFKTTIAHGYLTLSLVAAMLIEIVSSRRMRRQASITGSTRCAFSPP